MHPSGPAGHLPSRGGKGRWSASHVNHGIGHGFEDGSVQAQRVGGLGIVGDDAAVHDVEFGNVAAVQDIHSHLAGVGAELRVVDAAGGEGTGGNEGIRAGVVVSQYYL